MVAGSWITTHQNAETGIFFKFNFSFSFEFLLLSLIFIFWFLATETVVTGDYYCYFNHVISYRCVLQSAKQRHDSLPLISVLTAPIFIRDIFLLLILF